MCSSTRALMAGKGGGGAAAAQDPRWAGDGGPALGGDAVINAKGDVSFGNGHLGAAAFGGDGSTGGDAISGNVVLEAWTGGAFDITGDLDLAGYALAGDGTSGNGGASYGGTINVI